MEDINNKFDRRMWLGGAFIVLGFLFLLNSLDILDFSISRIIFSWPFFFLVIGVFITLNTNKKLLGGILSGLGAIFIIPHIFPDVHYNGTIVFAIIFIALGLYIILNKKETEKIKFDQERKDYLEDVSIFGGGSKFITSDNFKGGNITAVFGGSEINLKGCKLAEGTNVIDVLCVFGGTTLIVPQDWNIILNVTPIFGGFSNKLIKDPTATPDLNKTLIIKGLVVFGGGEIKSYL
ncbi:LiaF transmembrane domain-containing protein [Ignavibacterium album]|uniref:LiaF transmembrane domain-containing protein n=1 Tax=Ignavibacterium album TaxID=591197 RepID=UPI0035B77365